MLKLPPEPAPETESDRKLLADVHAYGLHVIHVLPKAGTPGWSYSIGLYRTRRQPEVVVFGLDQKVAHFVVNELGRRATDGAFEPEQAHEGLLDGHTCILKNVHQCWYKPFFGYGLWYYRHAFFPVLQVVWPDHDQRYPWDPEFKAAWRWAQPFLYLDEPAQANAVALLQSMGPSAAG